jgi:hypothetical protein
MLLFGRCAKIPKINRTLPRKQMRSSVKSTYPPPFTGLIRSSSSMDPPAPSTGILNQPASGPSDNHHGPRVLCSGRVMLSLPSTLLQPDPPVSTTPADFPHWLYGGSLPYDLIWAVVETFPALGQHSFPTCRHPYAGRRNRNISPVSPLSPWLSATEHCVSSSTLPTPASVEALLTTLQCSLYAAARRVARPSGLVRPRAMLRPPKTCTSELPRGRSPEPRVGYNYTAPLGKNCGRTFTGWSAAVTGCAFCCKKLRLWSLFRYGGKSNDLLCSGEYPHNTHARATDHLPSIIHQLAFSLQKMSEW